MLNLNRANLSLDPLNAAINARIEQASLAKHANDVPRDYLGASLIGEACLRKIQFEWQTSCDLFGTGAFNLCARALFRDREQAATA